MYAIQNAMINVRSNLLIKFYSVFILSWRFVIALLQGLKTLLLGYGQI